MNKLTVAFVILIIITTLVLSVTKPALHKQVMITDADFTFVEEPANNVSQPSTPIPEKTVPSPSKQVVPKVSSPQKKENISTEPVKSKKTTQTQKVVKQSQPVKSQSVKSQTPTQNTEKKSQTTPAKKQTAAVSKTQTVQAPVQSKPVQQTSSSIVKKEETKPQTQSSTTVHQLTEQEEIIAWNKWRSDLQNQVMRDTKIAAPLGTTFKFSFTVDKFGNLSNIKVWSLNPVYSETAVRVIKPVLSSYQGKPVLNFPQGTKRVITNVTGGFTMATSTGYSKPSDYSDYERVKK